MGHYAPKKELAEAVRESQASGTISPRMAHYCEKIVEGIAKKKGIPEDQREDLRQDCFIIILRKLLHNIDVEGNIFGYLTMCVINEALGNHRKRRTYESLCKRFARAKGYIPEPWQEEFF